MTNLLDSIRPFDKQVPLVGALMAAAVLSACGGSDDPAGTLRLGGTVAGLAAGKSVELQNNGAEALRVSENGRFSFSTPLESDAAYAVTVKTQPDGQTCTVARGAGSALVSPMGSVTLSRVESNASIAAHWGSWRLITGSTSYLVLAKPSNDKLCLLGDENPSILPRLERVAQSAAVQDQQNACYVRR